MVDVKAHIESNPKIMLGKPVIKGTRITVELILQKMADGFDVIEILEMYPILHITDIHASISYAASVISNEDVIEAA